MTNGKLTVEVSKDAVIRNTSILFFLFIGVWIIKGEIQEAIGTMAFIFFVSGFHIVAMLLYKSLK